MRILNLIYAPIRYASTRYLSQTINHDKNVKKVKSKFIICGKELIIRQPFKPGYHPSPWQS